MGQTAGGAREMGEVFEPTEGDVGKALGRDPEADAADRQAEEFPE